MCWNGGNQFETLVTVTLGSDSTDLIARNNFVAPNEITFECQEQGQRIYTADQGCVSGADDATQCLANLPQTPSPTAYKSPAPTMLSFLGRVPCPSDRSIIGYTSIESLNSDMAVELDRIRMGGAISSQPYTVSLCPGVFDASKGPITPLLANFKISCGRISSSSSLSPSSPCTITGGSTQILIQDSALEGYNFTGVEFEGISLQNFGGTSVMAEASAPTTVTFRRCFWLVRIL